MKTVISLPARNTRTVCIYMASHILNSYLDSVENQYIIQTIATVLISVAISVLLLFCTDTDSGKNLITISLADIIADQIIGTPLEECTKLRKSLWLVYLRVSLEEYQLLSSYSELGLHGLLYYSQRKLHVLHHKYTYVNWIL